MQKLMVFNNTSLDGYFVAAQGTSDFARVDTPDEEWEAFLNGNASGGDGGTFLFGRVTYEEMASFWPTPAAAAAWPILAQKMNATPKVVFSRTLDRADWENTTLLKGDLVTETRKLKEAPGSGILIFGSGTVVAQLTDARLIDEYQIVQSPVAIGKGRTMFDGIKEALPLKLISARSFKNGKIFLRYEPAG